MSKRLTHPHASEESRCRSYSSYRCPFSVSFALRIAARAVKVGVGGSERWGEFVQVLPRLDSLVPRFATFCCLDIELPCDWGRLHPRDPLADLLCCFLHVPILRCFVQIVNSWIVFFCLSWELGCFAYHGSTSLAFVAGIEHAGHVLSQRVGYLSNLRGGCLAG